MESSPNQNIEPLKEREKRILEHIDFVLDAYDRSIETSTVPQTTPEPSASSLEV